MNLDKWKSQIVRGTLEYCVLLMLGDRTRYGYEILQELERYPIISSTESTVYPLLRRLQKAVDLAGIRGRPTAAKILRAHCRR